MGDKSLSLTAVLAPAYEPELGVKNFTRRFNFNEPGDFVIDDAINTIEPKKITTYFHSDNKINKAGDGFVFEDGKSNLLLGIETANTFDTIVEPNILTAPGQPGSVDKGERELRGVRLAISTPKRVTEANLRVRLKIRN